MDSISSQQSKTDSISARLSQIEQLLGSDPLQADAQAAELLNAEPENPVALLYQGIARRLLRNPESAVEILTRLTERNPDAPLVYLHLGLALRETYKNEAALQSLRKAVSVKPDFADAWLALADLLTAMADKQAANEAFITYARYSSSDPRLRESVIALREKRFGEAESRLQKLLEVHPNDIVVLCMLAETAVFQLRGNESEQLLKRCLELAPGFTRARHNYAVLLLQHNKAKQAMLESEKLLAEESENPDFHKLRAAIHVHLREYPDAIRIYQGLLDSYPNQPGVWTSLGHSLKSVGRRKECVEAYRRAISVAPQYGEAYWSIANIKTEQFTDKEVENMLTQLSGPKLADEDRMHFYFAIGKALEDIGEYAESFRHYEKGNGLRRKNNNYDANVFSHYVQSSKNFFSQEFFAKRSDYGAEVADPIFIIGLPRSGSTLVEQILASHSNVEGTTELTEITALAMSLGTSSPATGVPGYPENLASLEAERFHEFGDVYIEQTRIQRKLGRPYFIDKMPNNFAHVGLIHLILPNARIIDVRRNPMANGFSIFKQHFARRQDFSYSQDDIGKYYRDYVELMAHFDHVLPGRVHRTFYEALVDDTENEVRRLLEYCNLPYEPVCLEFYKNQRTVSTPSSEQVRSPIYRTAIDQWHHYETWLEPLEKSLGPLIDSYPDVPELQD